MTGPFWQRLAFVVPTRNRAGDLGRMLGSIRSGTARPDQIIVVDGGDDGQDSEVVFSAEKGVTYLVAVDGVGGETGTVQLNHELAKVPTLDSVTGMPMDC